MTDIADLPLVSVVIPVFNGQRYLPETLQSVSAQTYSNLEIIVVNDGSTDDTPAVIERHATLDRRMRAVHTENRGLSSARNRGIEEALGHYVSLVDADDLWHPDKIARQFSVMKNSNDALSFVYTYTRFIDADGFVLEDCIPLPIDGLAFTRHLLTNFVASGSNILATREALMAVGMFRKLMVKGCEDYDLQLTLAAVGPIGLVPAYLVAYRRYPGTMSTAAMRMARSRRLTVESHLSDPRLSAECRRWARSSLDVVEIGAALKERNLLEAAKGFWRLATGDPKRLLSELDWSVRGRGGAGASAPMEGGRVPFADADPELAVSSPEPRPLSPLQLQRLTSLAENSRS